MSLMIDDMRRVFATRLAANPTRSASFDDAFRAAVEAAYFAGLRDGEAKTNNIEPALQAERNCCEHSS